MRFDTGQHLRMDQRMKLAPRMIQSMEILQMAQPALEERIEQELASNPTLEQVEPGRDAASLLADREQQRRDDREGERELVVADGTAVKDKQADDFERLSNITEQYGDSWSANTSEAGESAFRRAASSYAGERDAKMDAMANAAARGASLYDQLIDQWHLTDLDEPTLSLGEYLIGQIDADGYLRPGDDELLASAPDGTTAARLGECVELLQEALEPTGLAARDLRDCLLLQIDQLAYQDPDADLDVPRTLVADHLKDIEANRYPKIAKATGLPIAAVQAAVQSLRRFHPHPGRLLAADTVRTITPDAVIEYDEETDTYTATLTHGRLPALQVSPAYEDMAADKSNDKKTRDFIGTNLRNARWLIDAVRQRHHTLLRVIGVVIQAQRDFFEQGEAALKPLPMTSVADQLGIHVATVSRAVSEKYLQTPRGIFPLRMFFSGGTETDDGTAMSWTAVQAKLKEVIDAEDKNKPLSDDALVDELKKHGIEIARRTVAKYRGQLNIPPARQRREY
ncbi:MAG: RNA polymerase factor sigma-54 [Planctomycetota bacterium]